MYAYLIDEARRFMNEVVERLERIEQLLKEKKEDNG